MPTENEIQKRAEEIHATMKYPYTLEYEKQINVCIFRYLAKLELKLEEIGK